MRNKRNTLAQAVRAALALGTMGLGLAAAPAAAQSVTALTREDLQRTGLTSLGDILQHLTVAGPTLNTGFNSGGDGETRVDLRNLGSQRTLVLVNGRRWVPNSATLDGAIDLNTIPLAIVEKVEVLLSGGSAIYGSDAIAGVINIITRTDYEGAEGSAYLGQNQEGDGRVESYDYTIGAKSERASVTAIASYVKQEPILAGDRAISATPVANIPGNNSNISASSSTPFGRFFGVVVPGSVTFDPTTGGYKPYNASVDGFNFAPDNYLSTPQERTALYVQGRYQVSDTVAFRTAALYSERRSEQRLAAFPITLGAAFGIPIAIVPGQQFNPFSQVLSRVQFRPDNTYVRRFQQDVDTWHFGAGFDGKFQLLEREWTWDANYSYARNEENDTRRNLVNLDSAIAALQPACTAANACVPIDVFHGPDAFTPEMAAAVLFEAHDAFEAEQWSYSTNLLTDLAQLPAGPLSFGAGYEFRREQGFGSADALASSAIGPLLTARGSFALDRFYAEFNAPLLKDAPLAELLTLTGAVGYDDYSTFGSTTSPKVGFLWKPTSELLVRGNWAKGFRAPSISELFQGNYDSYPSVFDVCTFSVLRQLGADVQARCRNGIAAIPGVPTGFETYDMQTAVLGGNPDLQPERSITRTLGLAYAPEAVEGLDLRLDWYDLEVRDAIGMASPSELVVRCYVGGDLRACEQSRLQRDNGGAIIRLFAGNINLPGGLETEGYDFQARYRLDTGFGRFDWNWDTTYVAYFGELGKPDRLECMGGGFVLDGYNYCFGGLATGNRAGTYGYLDGPVWRVRSNLLANWSLGDWGATIGIRYYSGLDEDCSGPASVGYADLCSDPDRVVNLYGDETGDPAPENHIGSRTYVDLQATWDAPWNARFTLGLNNAFDRDPPIAYSAAQNSFDPQYPVPGRFWYAQYTQKF